MPSDVGIRLGVDGEKELRNALKGVDSQLKSLSEEMKSTVNAFADMEESEESVAAKSDVLNRQIDTQDQKISILNKQYDSAKAELAKLGNELDKASQLFGENSVEAGKAQNAYNRQVAEVNRLASQTKKAENDLISFERSLKNVGNEAKDLADEMQDAGKGIGGFGDIAGKLGGVAKVAGPLGIVAGAAGGLAAGINNIVNESLEFNKIMGALEASSQKAGYSAQETEASYKQLYGIIGDQQQSATALANLQAIGLSQEDLTLAIDGAMGAWIKYGDSIPIDGLAEAINETISVGKVTGNFADVLNRAKVSEDEFNEKLASATTETQRAQIVLNELARQGLPGVADGFRENNAELVALNEANANLDAAMGALGETFTPVVAMFKEGLATMVFGMVDAVDKASDMVAMVREIGSNLVSGLWNGIRSKSEWLKNKVENWCTGILNTVKNFFGIESPSKLMEQDVGEMLSAGMAKGVTNGRKYVVNAVQTLGNDVVNANIVTPPVNQNQGTIEGLINGLSAIGGQPINLVAQVVMPNGAVLAEAVFNDLRSVAKQRGVSVGTV